MMILIIFFFLFYYNIYQQIYSVYHYIYTNKYNNNTCYKCYLIKPMIIDSLLICFMSSNND